MVRRKRWFGLLPPVFLGWLLVLATLLPQTLAAQDQQFDALILNGRVFDGSGNPWIHYDIGVRGDEIVALGKLKAASAGRIVDATGLYVSPGFIDLHSHADRSLASDDMEARRAESLVAQGLTTVIGGADGRTVDWPPSVASARYEEAGMGMNMVLMAGHNTIRGRAMGDDFRRQATAEEIARMKAMLSQSMEEGAFGLGAGLEYDPGRYSSPDEVVELASVLTDYDGFYIAHQRSEASMPLWQLPSQVDGWPIDGLQALQETINIARQTGIRVVASHHKSRGRSSFGRSAHDILLINRARHEEGLQVYLDVYPYETFGGGPRPMLPGWSLADGDGNLSDEPSVRRQNLRRNWSDPATGELMERDIAWRVDHNGGPDRVLVVDYPDRSYVGRSLAELAAEQDKSFQEIVVEMALNGYEAVPWGGVTRGHGINDLDVENYIRQDYTATSSDAGASPIRGTGRPGIHPRMFGAFVRKIARYVKDKGVISLPFAIRSSTGLPAQIIGLRDRGLIREGYKADLVIFDYDRLRDRATVLEPELENEGIEFVLVNGEFTVDGGRLSGTLPGTVIKKR